MFFGRQIFSFLKKFMYLFLFSYNCLHFLPIPSPHPSQSHRPPPPLPSPLILSFIVAPIDPSPHYLLLTPLRYFHLSFSELFIENVLCSRPRSRLWGLKTEQDNFAWCSRHVPWSTSEVSCRCGGQSDCQCPTYDSNCGIFYSLSCEQVQPRSVDE